MNLPAWGSPVVAGGRVFVGLGNGQLTQAAPPPQAGWRASMRRRARCMDVSGPDAVFGRPVAWVNGWCSVRETGTSRPQHSMGKRLPNLDGWAGHGAARGGRGAGHAVAVSRGGSFA